jgi:hypothetical protein
MGKGLGDGMKGKVGILVFVSLALLLFFGLGRSLSDSDEASPVEVREDVSDSVDISETHDEKDVEVESIAEESKETQVDLPAIPASGKEPELFEIVTDEELTQYLTRFSLDTLKIKNYKKSLKRLSEKDNDYIQNFVGKFRGKMATHGGYFSIEPAVFDAEVEISGEKVDGQFVGDIEVKLIDKSGKVFSHSQFHGAIDSFFTDEGIDNPNLFSEDGDKNPSFYQLFLSSSLNQLVGNYYAPPVEGTSKYRRIGTLRLNKVL